MKLATFTHNGTTRTGTVRDGKIIDLNATDETIPTDMVSLLVGGEVMMSKARAVAESGNASLNLRDVRLESPILVPPRIFAIGLNYEAHFNEVPDEVKQRAKFTSMPESPIMFNKQNTSVNGPYDPVKLPPESEEFDYEAELGVIIGRTCRRVPTEKAMDVVAGYTIVNDLSIRDWQRAAPTMMMGKSWDTHCPMGPVIVTADEVDPRDLNVKLWLNDEERQNFSTGDMHFDIPTQIAYLSTAMTLLPGDVIATGTSAGVGFFWDGQRFLKDGDVVRIEIERIGYIENKVIVDPGESFVR